MCGSKTNKNKQVKIGFVNKKVCPFLGDQMLSNGHIVNKKKSDKLKEWRKSWNSHGQPDEKKGLIL